MKMFKKKGPFLQVRWAQPYELNSLASIERCCFDDPWSTVEIRQTLSLPTVICKAALLDQSLVGFAIIQLEGAYYHLLNMAVLPGFQRLGIGSALVGNLKDLLGDDRPSIKAETRETNLGAQLFFRANGFRCRRILRDHYSNGQTAYQFEYK